MGQYHVAEGPRQWLGACENSLRSRFHYRDKMSINNCAYS